MLYSNTDIYFYIASPLVILYYLYTTRVRDPLHLDNVILCIYRFVALVCHN
jgi:hypothetical protein